MRAMKGNRGEMSMCGKTEERDQFLEVLHNVVFFMNKFMHKSLLTLQSYYWLVRLREHTSDWERELWVECDTYRANKQPGHGRLEPKAINSTEIWALGSVYWLISQHTTKTHWARDKSQQRCRIWKQISTLWDIWVPQWCKEKQRSQKTEWMSLKRDLFWTRETSSVVTSLCEG